ncbi:MAG: flagellar basal body rod protein FlgB [Buchnera aphidicola (Pentalonia nigronervosa)]|uniref:Flagellar basal body rod protein FlgB n=1 Tax=Buchnera aphidicola (Pentalonia nigronervosa) TaxID=1309793 RepID=A0A7H1AZW0_9GAMM|nr:MAG: flagellar basal body rod protein FlgB [Buchnera aphidicola (Pentalonia nigronervosa)]
MFTKINHMFDFNQNMLNLYSKQQEILASNIANVDTPGYNAIDINFKETLKNVINQTSKNYKKINLQHTSSGHLNPKVKNTFFYNIQPVIQQQIKSNRNTVDMNYERVNFLKNSLKYQSILVFMKNDIKNIQQVLQG